MAKGKRVQISHKVKWFRKHLFMVYASVIVFALLINASIYVFVTKPAINDYFTGSIFQFSEQSSDQTKDWVQSDDLSAALDELRSDLGSETSRQEARLKVVLEQLVDDRLSEIKDELPVTQPTVVHRNAPVTSSSQAKVPAPPPVAERRKASGRNGSMRVADPSCPTGYAWIDPRLSKDCE